MAITGYLEFEDIKGESQRSDHEEQVDVHGCKWHVRQRSSAATGSGRTQARSEVGGMTFYKWYDASSPYLALTAMKGSNLKTVKFYARKDSGDVHLDYLTIKMDNCIITEYEMLNVPGMAATEGQDEGLVQSIEERLTLSFENIDILYKLQKEDHSTGDEHEVEYDIAAMK